MNENVARQINDLAAEIHYNNRNWWVDLNLTCPFCDEGTYRSPFTDVPAPIRPCKLCLGTGHPRIARNVGELLMLCVSELAEAMEGHRKSLQDDHLPHREMLEVELADCTIRILDLAAGLGLDLGGALVEKLQYNLSRKDHSVEARLEAGGKAY